MLSTVSRCVLYSQRRVHKQSVTNAIYVVLFFYLVLYSILNTVYTDNSSKPAVAQLNTYDIKDVVVNSVTCSFPTSGQYQRTPRYICYLLLTFTITVRSHGWLAVGAATSVLTYSAVAAIHLLIVFATNNRLYPPQAATRCESIPIPGSNIEFIACAGIVDSDVSATVHIVSCVMLGALPMSAWSTTFRKSASKAILMFWLLVLAVGHTCFPLISNISNLHFQICPKDYVETLPKFNFQAPPLDNAWSESFNSLVLASQQASPFFENGSFPACLYSCFATTAYIGHSSKDVIIFTSTGTGPFVKQGVETRICIDIFWWTYAFLALLTFITTEKQGRLPKWAHKQLCSVEYHQQPWISMWKYKSKSKYVTKIVNHSQGKGNDTTTASSLAAARPNSMKKFQITILKLIQLIIQFTCMFAFGASIIFLELTQEAEQGTLLEQEPFAAVGQWSCVAVVILVLFAAIVGRMWGGNEKGGESGSSTDKEMRSLAKGNETRDGEWMSVGDWDWRVGYAS